MNAGGRPYESEAQTEAVVAGFAPVAIHHLDKARKRIACHIENTETASSVRQPPAPRPTRGPSSISVQSLFNDRSPNPRGCFIDHGQDPLDVLSVGVRHNVWFVLDSSGSMGGYHKKPNRWRYVIYL